MSAGPGLVREVIRRQRRALVHIVGWSVVESVPSLVSGLAIAAATQRFLEGRTGAGLLMLALLPAGAVVGAVATRRLFPWLADIVEPVRDALLEAVIGSKVAGPPGAGDVGAAQIGQQVEAVRHALFALLRQVRRIAFTVVAVLTGLAVLTPLLAAGTAVLVLAAGALFGWLLPGLVARHRSLLAAEENLADRTSDTFAGLRDTLAVRASPRALTELGVAIDGQVTAERALGRTTARRGLVVLVGGQLPLLAFLTAAPWLLSTGQLTVSAAVGAATYLAVNLEPALRGLVGIVGGPGVALVVNLRRLAETTDRPEPPGTTGAALTGSHDLRLRQLTFAYGPHSTPVVRDLNLHIAEGEHLAVIGPSGIGKSTLAGLLTGLLAPQRGQVLLGGVDVRTADPAALGRAVALVPQETYVFAGTLRENLTYLAPAADDEQIVAATHAVGLHPLLARVGGLDGWLGADGAQLSHGELQLVVLCRVYLSPARVVILDEATAHLDPVAEQRAEAAFADRAGTLIVIAHRLSSARRAGRVLVFDGDECHVRPATEFSAASPVSAVAG